ncbi:Na+/H+ antiporter subunit E [Georgenia faecalis]|uniref:Na+/H+ antiporter subunit E n=1 Tax=Georgenia faecalis TaxID=2483799 RepID=A0ABV9D7J0_9MICO
MSSVPPAMRVAPSHRRRRLRASWAMLLWLTVVWVLLWGDLSLANVVNGLLIAVFLTTLLPLPPTPFDGSFRPWGVVRLLVRFLRDVVVASYEVALLAVRGGEPHGGVIRVKLRSHSDVYLTMTAGMTSLVPGSIVIEAHRLTGTLYIHVVDLALQGGIERAHQAVLDQEERILRAFASDAELADAGLAPGASPRAGQLAARPDADADAEHTDEDRREGEAR